MRRTHSDIARTICIATGAAAVASAGALAICANSLFRFALDSQYKKSMFRQSPPDDPERERLMNTGEAREAGVWFQETKQPVTITSFDGLTLHGWLFDPDCISPKPHLYAICCHGYTGEPAEMATWAHRFARLGFTVLVPAQRAHEMSEGAIPAWDGWNAMTCSIGFI